MLVDEAQDLNDANHLFLRRCVSPVGASTVVCAVGDPAQSIYQFRGVHPDALGRLRRMFDATPLQLTCCFRCPRRIVSVAAHLHPSIRASPDAALGTIQIHKVTDAWKTLEKTVHWVPPEESVLFVARTNRHILNLVVHLYHQPADSLLRGRGVRWAAPVILNELNALMQRNTTDCAIQTVIEDSHWDDSRSPLDGVLVLLLQTALQVDGQETELHDSSFLAFVTELLTVKQSNVTLATIHASKGAEHDHVVVYQYNLIGGTPDDGQERNLLYIAVTRARKTLTFLLHGRSQHVPSALLPCDIIQFSGIMVE